MNTALGLTITLGAVVCCTDLPVRSGLFTGAFLAARGPRGWLARLSLDVSLLAVLGLVGVVPGIGRLVLSRAVVRRAATPFPPTAPDPLATYRDARAECPRHPFAR